MEDLRPVTAVFKTGADMTSEERLMRVDTLLCILFGGLVNHPLATTLVPPAELEQLKRILPQDTDS
jgi:hypothetical protein